MMIGLSRPTAGNTINGIDVRKETKSTSCNGLLQKVIFTMKWMDLRICVLFCMVWKKRKRQKPDLF